MTTVIRNRLGKKLSVEITGPNDAPTVLFSNSLGTDKGMWEPQVNVMKADYRIVTYDTRGHGASEVVENTKLENLGADAIDILDGLSIAKAHFCGISMGGLTGLWLGIHHPHRFHSVTIANAAARIGAPAAWQERAEMVARYGLASVVSGTPARWFSDNFDYQQDKLAMRAIQSLADTSPQGYGAACRALADADLREQINEIPIAALIIVGTRDPVTTVADGQFMQTHIPDSKLSKLAASHLSNIEQPEAFSQELRHFIESLV